jgi:hypothetical protein
MSNEFPAITRRSALKSRSISGENLTGAPGSGGMATQGTGADPARRLGQGWKVSPSIPVPARTEVTLADIDGPGVLQHLWLSIPPQWWRSMVLRIYWDGSERPSVEVPLGDFFGLGWDTFATLSSKYVVSAPYCALNSYWPLPFHGHARVTLENLRDLDAVLYYYIDYGLGEIPADSMYFHGTWHRDNPVRDGIHAVLDAEGPGKYVGTYLAVGVNHPGWWGEGEVKFYIDDDGDFPTICGTGTEDFFGGAWDFEVPGAGYTAYSTHYVGLHQIVRPDGLYQSQQRFGMYRWHELDPVNFEARLRVEVQDLGWLREGEYLVRADDLASTAFWYAAAPRAAGSDALSIDSMLVSSHPARSVHAGG